MWVDVMPIDDTNSVSVWKERPKRQNIKKTWQKWQKSKLLNIAQRVFSILFFLIMLLYIWDWLFLTISLLLLSLITNPIFLKYINKQNRFSILKTFRAKIVFFLCFLAISFILLPGWWKVIQEFKISQWNTDAKIFVDFEYTLASLIESYKVATKLEQQSFKLKYWDLTEEEYQKMLKLLRIKREDVKQNAIKLKTFEKYAPIEMSYFNPQNIFITTLSSWVKWRGTRNEIEGSLNINRIDSSIPLSLHSEWQILNQVKSTISSINSQSRQILFLSIINETYAQWLASNYEQDQRSEEVDEKWKEIDRNAEKRKEVDLIKKDIPKKRWFEIVSDVFAESTKKAKKRLLGRQRTTKMLYKSEIDYINTNEQQARIFQNWVKIVEWWWMLAIAISPVWWLALVSLDALWVWVWVADLSLTFMETKDLMQINWMDKKLWEGLDYIDKKYDWAKKLAWYSNFIFNAKTLIEKPLERNLEKWIAGKSILESFSNWYNATNEKKQSRWYYEFKEDDWKFKIIEKETKPDWWYNFFRNEDLDKFWKLLDDDEVSIWFKDIAKDKELNKYLNDLQNAEILEKAKQKQAKEDEELRKKQEELARKKEVNLEKQTKNKAIKKAIERVKQKQKIIEEKKEVIIEPTKPMGRPGEISNWWCRNAWLAVTCGSSQCRCCNWPDVSSCEWITVK